MARNIFGGGHCGTLQDAGALHGNEMDFALAGRKNEVEDAMGIETKRDGRGPRLGARVPKHRSKDRSPQGTLHQRVQG